MKKICLIVSLNLAAFNALSQTTHVEVNPLEHLDKLEHEIEFRVAADQVFSHLKQAQEAYEAEKQLRYKRFEQCQQILCQLDVAKALINNEISYSEALELISDSLSDIQQNQLHKAKNALQGELTQMQELIQIKASDFVMAWQEASNAFQFSGDGVTQNNAGLSAAQQAEMAALGLELIAQKYEIESLLQQLDLVNADIQDYSHVTDSIHTMSLQIDTRAKTHSTEARKLTARTELVARVGSSNEHNQQLHNMMGRFAGYSASSGIDNRILGELGGFLSGERQTVDKVIPGKIGDDFDMSMFEEISAFVNKLSAESLMVSTLQHDSPQLNQTAQKHSQQEPNNADL